MRRRKSFIRGRSRNSLAGVLVIAVIAIGAALVAIVRAIVEAIAQMSPDGQIGLVAFVLAAAFVGIAVKAGWARNWLALARKQEIKAGRLAARYKWFRWWYAPLSVGILLLVVLIVLTVALEGGGRPSAVRSETVMPEPTATLVQGSTSQPTGTKSPETSATDKPSVTKSTSAPTKSNTSAPQPTKKPTLRPTARPTSRPTFKPQPTSAPVNCCKHCGPNSKPCGDSCISLDKTCHKVGGCACP